MKVRDTQRARVYACEAVLETMAGTRYETVPEMERFVDRVWSFKRLRDKYPSMGRVPPTVLDGRRCRRAKGASGWIKMPKWSRTAHILCHELSHTIASRQFGSVRHGPEFCQVYLDVVLHTLGREAHDALKASMKKHGVRYRPKKKVAPLDPERKAKLIATLAAARAKRAAEAAAKVFAPTPLLELV